MPNPLSEAFQDAARVRAELEGYVYSDSGKWWTWHSDGANGVWRESCEDTAERCIEAACWRELPGYWWDKAGDEFVVFKVTHAGLDYEPVCGGDTLTLALLAAVAGLGGGGVKKENSMTKRERTRATGKKATIGEKIVGDHIAHILKAGASAKGTIDLMTSGNYMHHKAQAKSQIDYMIRLLMEPKWLDSLAGAFNRKHSAAVKRAVRETYDLANDLHDPAFPLDQAEARLVLLKAKYGVNLK